MQCHPLLEKWRSTLTPRERELHDLAAILLKKSLVTNADDKDNGSYFPEKCHAFKKWLKEQPQ